MAAARQNGGAFNFTLHPAEYLGEGFGHDELANSKVGLRVPILLISGWFSTGATWATTQSCSIIEPILRAWAKPQKKSIAERSTAIRELGSDGYILFRAGLTIDPIQAQVPLADACRRVTVLLEQRSDRQTGRRYDRLREYCEHTELANPRRITSR